MEDFLEDNKEAANEEGLVKAVDSPAPLPLFLSETELKNQGNPYAWRKGVADTTSNIFRTPRSTPEFPRIFQNVPKRVQVPTKALPFTYKAFHKMAKPEKGEPEKGEPEKAVDEEKPTITVPAETEEPAYAPTTP